MQSERVREITEQLKQRMAEYAATKHRLQNTASATDEIIGYIGELERLFSARHAENSSDPGDVDAAVVARLKPKPPLNSGSIAIPLPVEPELETSFPPSKLHFAAAR